MVEQMVGFFASWFANPSMVGIGLAILFGAIWLVGYWPPLFKKPWLWAVFATWAVLSAYVILNWVLGIGLAIVSGAIWLACYWSPLLKKQGLCAVLAVWAVFVGSAILSLAAVTFVQIPLQLWTGRALGYFWSEEIILSWLLLAGIPQILLSGLVQEGSKLVPIVVWWWRSGKNITPKLGLTIGAVAGAGLGVFEAVWVHNMIFASGWGWETVQTSGLMALAGFWERFFAVAFHIAVSALAGYGLAKGWGWQFYLLAASLHALVNYSVILLKSGIFTTVHVEIYAAAVAVLLTGGVLWLRWRRERVQEIPETSETREA